LLFLGIIFKKIYPNTYSVLDDEEKKKEEAIERLYP
jgi:hypothetical protein